MTTPDAPRIVFLRGVAHVCSEPTPSVWQHVDERGRLWEHDSVMTSGIERRATREEVEAWREQG